MRVLVTGTDGYIGAILGSELMSKGHEVVGIDTGFYRAGWLFTDPSKHRTLPETRTMDIRRVQEDDLLGFDAVVHLAELSNDPLGESNPAVTYDINHTGSIRLAEAAKRAGVHRFVYTSSCSVYGLSDAEIVDERSPVNPQTAYAECKVNVEHDLQKLASDEFVTVMLRNATAYGISPRMRFDIVLNNLAGLAWTTGKIAMISDGSPWRPIVHIEDIASAAICALEAPAETVQREVFNVGASGENYRIREIAEIVNDAFPECEVTFGQSGGDNRSYRVSFDKIESGLPGFRCRWSAPEGALQLRNLFERLDMGKADFENPPFTRLECLKRLIASGQIDQEYYWTSL